MVETLEILWCDSLYRQNISTLEIHCHLMLVFGDNVLRPHSCRERVKRVQEWVGIHHEDWTFQPARSRTWTQCKRWNWFWKTIKTQFKILSIALDWFVKNVPNIVHGQLRYSSVCAWWVPRYRMEVHENLMFGYALPLLQLFKGGANGFPESVVTLWDMGLPFYSKWALMQWTHSSSLKTTKCKVCHYVWRQWHLYSVLQESSYKHMLWHAKLTALGY